MSTVAREEYQRSLDDLRADVVAMGEDVLDQLDRGLDALERTDEELARQVVDGDDAVNERYLELEGDCIDLLALQQPVASDLRFVAASFKVLTDLERVGDLATNFGRYAMAADGDRPAPVDGDRSAPVDDRPAAPADGTNGTGHAVPPGDGDDDRLAAVEIAPIGEAARDQVRAALDAYAADDAEAARAVVARDDEIDALCQRASERVVRDLIEREAGDDAWAVERLMDDVSRLLLTVRDLERVGDHAVNVAARTLYAVENDPTLVY